MRDHHRKAVETMVSDLVSSGAYDAVILVGSVARGTEREDSDLDVYLVAPEADYQDRRSRHDLAYYAECDYPGGYVDGKVISLAVLHEAAARAPEPMRASFTGATVVHSSIGDLQPLVDQIAVYPEANRAKNMRDFYALFALNAWYFAPQALERNDAFLLTRSLGEVVLYAGRLILAKNRILFPCAKQLLATVDACPDRPAEFRERTRELLEAPTTERLGSYLTRVSEFADWGLPSEEVLSTFMELDEWSWLTADPSPAQR